MMQNIGSQLSALALVFAAQGALAFDHKVILLNQGPLAAEGISVVLEGPEFVTATYNGNHHAGLVDARGLFGHVIKPVQPVGDTVIDWGHFSHPADPTLTSINVGKHIEIGWSVRDCKSQVKDMYWTYWTASRYPPVRIEGNIVRVLGSRISFGTTEGQGPIVRVNNNMEEAEIALKGLRFAVLPQELPLADLSANNEELLAMLTPVEGGEAILSPGEALDFELPVTVEPGQALIVVYESRDAASEDPAGARPISIVQLLRDHHDPLPCMRIE